MTRVVIFLHGTGPGCTWARTVHPGSRHDFLGPTRALKISDKKPLALFGDETVFGLGLALQNAAAKSAASRLCFEVSNAQESRDVLAMIGLHGAELVERTGDYEHLAQASLRMSATGDEEQQIVLSGNARSIQQVRKALATRLARTSGFIVKPYWSPGKKGMS